MKEADLLLPEPTSDCLRTALPRDFYRQETVNAARLLLNCLLMRNSPDGLTVGRISETEAYTQDDPACHAYRGRTARNAMMFGEPGRAYIYFTYGMHYCFNAVTGLEGQGDAVLIRAVEPLQGWELLSRRRGLSDEEIARLLALKHEHKVRVRWARALCGGPGKICQAFDLKQQQNGIDLTHPGELWIAPPLPEIGVPDFGEILSSPRIGITQAVDTLWRFTLENDPYTSRK